MTHRQIKYLVVHTTASGQHWTAADVQRYFLEELKWGVGGYHKMVEASGQAVRLHPDATITNGVYPFVHLPEIVISNRNTLHVAWIGGLDRQARPVDNRTMAQRATLRNLVLAWLKQYPEMQILGHGQVRAKACPCFDVPNWCQEIGVPERNIYRGDHYGNLADRPWERPIPAPLPPQPVRKGGDKL